MKRSCCSPYRIFENHRGFTFLELLVSIAIIGVLAAIVYSTVGTMRRRAQSIQCMGNLRQIGNAVLLYATDHAGVLPGPMAGGVNSIASEWGMRPENLGNLVNYLAGYFGVPHLPHSATYELKAFQCPAAMRQTLADFPNADMNAAQCYLHLATFVGANVTERAFGYKATGTATLPPMRLNQLRDASRSIALIDRDNELLQLFGGPTTSLPRKAVHGGIRMVLFFDGHVESVANERLSVELRALKIN